MQEWLAGKSPFSYFISLHKKTQQENTTYKMRNQCKTSSNLGPYDVLCCKTSMAFNYLGNRRFRILVDTHTHKYAEAANKLKKSHIVNTIVQTIEKAGGTFLTKVKGSNDDEDNSTWEPICLTRAKEKVGHALRRSVLNYNKQKAISFKRKSYCSPTVSLVRSASACPAFKLDDKAENSPTQLETLQFYGNDHDNYSCCRDDNGELTKIVDESLYEPLRIESHNEEDCYTSEISFLLDKWIQ